MARVTLVAFALLTGFFYVTGKPVDETGQEINRFADFAIPKVVAEEVVDETTSKHLISNKNQSMEDKASNRNSTAERGRKLASIKAPELPSRNPRRIAARSSKLALAHRSSAALNSIKLAKVETTATFQQGRNKFTGGAVKPLGLSYQQRYVKSQKPVLGPRLTAVLVKRELRRIGCYRGNVTSNWDDSARAAITSFNIKTGSNLAIKTPLVSSLERLQQITKTVCVEQPVIDGTIIASAGQRKTNSKAKSFTKVSKWRTKVRVRKAAYRPSTTSQTPRYNDYASPAR